MKDMENSTLGCLLAGIATTLLGIFVGEWNYAAACAGYTLIVVALALTEASNRRLRAELDELHAQGRR